MRNGSCVQQKHPRMATVRKRHAHLARSTHTIIIFISHYSDPSFVGASFARDCLGKSPVGADSGSFQITIPFASNEFKGNEFARSRFNSNTPKHRSHILLMLMAARYFSGASIVSHSGQISIADSGKMRNSISGFVCSSCTWFWRARITLNRG